MKLSLENLVQRLTAELGATTVSEDAATLRAHGVDGKVPALFCAPANAEEVSAALRVCGEAEAAVIPWGGGSAMPLGNPPRVVDLVLATTKLNRVIEHDDANLTATVQSGVVLNDLQKALAPQKQRAPFDPPFPERATIGGIVAANLNGPRRSFYGNVRDLVIGMKVALASGEQIKAGGKVVKNVAGYDMCKLFTGSLGTLGVITEVTLRMAAIPEQRATIGASGTWQQALQLAEAIVSSPLAPAAVLLTSHGVLGDSPKDWQLTLLCEGFAETIGRQGKDIQAMAQAIGIQSWPVDQQNSEQQWQALCNFPARQDTLVYRVTVPRAALGYIVESAADWNFAPAIFADIAAAVVWIACPASDTAIKFFPKLIDLARQRRGHAVLFAAPPEQKTGLDVWGPTPPSFALMRKVKQQFDPRDILNPGRFIGSL